jgi:hypothetical protein
MRIFILAVAVFLLVPTCHAQQTETHTETESETKTNPPQPGTQESTENSGVQSAAPEAIRPGHTLDPADVDILTGKRDREIEASRRPPASLVLGTYGGYGDAYAIYGRRGAILNLPLLPLTQIANPYFFFDVSPRGFGRGGFRGRR